MLSMLTRIENIHKHNLRNQNSYYIQNIRTNSRKCTINYSGPVFWNALPSKLKQLVSINQFKNKLKNCYSLNINDFTVNTANKKLCICTKCTLYLHLFSHGGEDHVFHAYVIFNVVRIMYYLMYSCSHLMNTQHLCS